MSEFKPHDYFMVNTDGYTSRKIFQEHVRKTYDQMRELADYIDQMIEELKQIGEEFEEKELDRVSAEIIRLANEVDRVNAESIRSEFYEGFDGEITALNDEVGKKANKQQEDWITPTLLNGYTHTLGGLKYMKDAMGFVHIEGFVGANANSVPQDTDCIQMPSGYLPETYRYGATSTNGGLGSYTMSNTGVLKLKYTGTPTWIAINIIYKGKV